MTVALQYLVSSAVDGPFGSSLASAHYADEGARVIRLGNIGDGFWRNEDAAFVPIEYAKQLARHEARPGDVVVAGLGDANNPLGRAAIVPDIGAAIVKADCFRLRLRCERLDARFFVYFMSARGTELARERAHGSTRQRLPLGEVLRIPVPLPPLEVQQRIADYLDTETARIDTLITKNEHAAALVEERHYAYLEHSIWRPEFPRRKLAGVCDPSRPIRYGIVLPGPSVDDGVPLIKGGDVHRQTLERGTDARVDREVEAGHVRSRVSPGDLVYTIRGSYGDVAVVPDNLPVANLTQDVARIAPRHVETHWLRFALDAPSARSYADVIATGATIRGVNIGDLRHMPVPVPEPSERDRILRETRRVLAFLASTEERLSKQRELLLERRQALITAAVTGEFEI